MIQRYTKDEIGKLWTEEAKYQAWFEVELLTLKAYAKIEPKILKKDIETIESKVKIDVKRIHEIEELTKHDVIAFTRSISEQLGEEKKWIHYGLTSTDVVDTALSYQISKANKLIQEKLEVLKKSLKSLAIEYRDTLQMGRTHGIHAEITTFGYKMALWFQEIERNIERFNLARKQIEVGKISGAVGNYTNIPIGIAESVCSKLGLDVEDISTQTLQRDRHANYIFCLALIGSSLDKFAIELRHLQRTEVGEVEEAFAIGQKGSSAMPHKKNPISAENISGLSRLLRGYVVTSMENIALWHERDISHSSNERVIFADATIIIYYILERFIKLIKNLKINSEKMLKNIQLTKNRIFSQQVLLHLINIKGESREKAYDFVQSAIFESYNKDLDFKDYLIKLNVFNREEIDSIFNINNCLINIREIFEYCNIK